MFRSMNMREQFDEMQANIAMADSYTALGACVFAGGFTFGMEQAGFEIAGQMELPDLNLGSWAVRQRWPCAVAPLHREYRYGSEDMKRGGVTWLDFIDRLIADDNVPDVFYANPPCVAYAKTGKHGGSLDERMCYVRYCAYEAALRLRPKIWAWELVPGVMNDRGMLEAMAYRASRHGYRSWAFLTSSALHGGFQNRKRFHFIASRYDLDFDGAYADEPEERRGWRTLGQMLEFLDAHRFHSPAPLPNDIDAYRGAFRALMPFTAPGSHLCDLPDELMHARYRPHGVAWTGNGRPGFGIMRGRLDRPCPNILGGATVVHPTEDRYMTPRECATAQGFPVDYEFNESTAYAEIGKGLCTHNASFLGRTMIRALDAEIAVEPSRELQVIDWRSRAKPPKLTMKLDEQCVWWWNKFGTKPPDGYGIKLSSRKVAAPR